MEGGDGPHALDLVDMAARLRQRLAEQRLRRPVAEQQQPLAAWRGGYAAARSRRTPRGRRRSSGRRARGSRKARRCRPARRGILIAASIRLASSQASPPIGCPAAKSSSVGASLSSMIAAFSGPCGMIRFAVAEASGSCVLLASQSWSSASVSWAGWRDIRRRRQVRRSFGGVRGAGGFSQSRGSSWTATSTPASSHQANALRASAMPIDSTSPPTVHSSPAIDATVKELAGQSSRNVWTARRDAATRNAEQREAHERTRIHGSMTW